MLWTHLSSYESPQHSCTGVIYYFNYKRPAQALSPLQYFEGLSVPSMNAQGVDEKSCAELQNAKHPHTSPLQKCYLYSLEVEIEHPKKK